MSTELYETIAQGARYWFVLLMIAIVARSYFWLRRDRRERKRRLRLLPDAGYVGELVVLKGNEDLAEGDELPLPCEGFIGSVRSCDVVLPVSGVSKRHAWFCYEKHRGVLIEPMYRQHFLVDGATIENHKQTIYLKHGTRLTIGDCVLRLRMFAGFESAGSASREKLDEPQTAQREADALPQPVSAEQLILAQQQLLLAQQQLLRQQAMRWQTERQPVVTPEEEDEYEPEAYDDAEPAPPEYAAQTEDEDDVNPFDSYLPPVSEDDGGLPACEDEDDWQPLPYPDQQPKPAPDKSLYVEQRDNEQADKLVWNKLMKRGRKP